MSSEFRLDNYLARIGFSEAIEPNLATLVAIHAAHVDLIPFEGFDPLLRRPVNLDIASLQKKLVDSRRGGYCFEQNLLFKARIFSARIRFVERRQRLSIVAPAICERSSFF